VREVVEALAGIDDGDSLEEARAALERLLPAGDERDTIVERLAGAVGLADQPAAPAEIAWAVRRVVEAAAAERGPLVLVFEDAHWGEGSFLDLVEYLARTLDGPVLLLLAARDDLLETRPELAGERVELAPLDEAESRELVGHLAGVGADPELAARALSAGEGNPLFVEELVRALAERPGESLPPTIHALLAARIEALAPDERAVAEAASVVGRSFGPEAAFGLVEGSAPERLAEGLRGLEGRGLVQPDGGRFAGEPTFSFKHSLIRDVAYQGILKSARADLHERFAGWLERTTGERAGEYEEILGHHLERACAYLEELAPLDERGRGLAERAAARLGASGRRALAREDVGPAVKLLERALSLTPEDDPARRDLSLKLGIALAEAGELSRADALLDARLRDERRGRAFVVFSEPGGRRQVIDLSAPATTVGRQEDSHVRLGWDSEVSRRHAELRPRDDGWLVVDEWSRNGSYLNGERVEGERPLRDGDVLRFGDTIVQFQAPAAAPQKAPSLDPAQATIQGKMPSDLGDRG
jgi:predicted ATPase